MKKQRMNKKEKSPRNVKSRFLAAIAMLVVSATLLASASFAWLVMSTAPEVSGIRTNIAANGALEIVLLDSETYVDPSRIRTTIGGTDTIWANNRWGNLVDLSYEEYGLNDILLLPSRLNLSSLTSVDRSSLLSVPTYDDNGQVISVTKNTLAATYANNAFIYNPLVPGYGVRAIGTSSEMSAQAAAMIAAKTNVKTYHSNAKTAAVSAMKNNGAGLSEIIVTKVTSSNFTDAHLNTIEAMVNGLQKSADWISDALRQGLIAVAASQLADETEFEQARTAINMMDLEDIQTELSKLNLNAGFTTWIEEWEIIFDALDLASIEIDELRGLGTSTYSWEQIKGVLDILMNIEGGVFINGYPFDALDYNELLNATNLEITLAQGSGIFADIAHFVDSYETTITFLGKTATVEVKNDVSPYLPELETLINGLNAAGGDSSGSSLELENTYGYVIDLGFRTNAALSDLLLQTDGIQRIYEDAISSATMGNGSCMTFNTLESNMENMELLRLADAIRVAFVTNDGSVLGIAKLNTSNYQFTDDTTIKVPLYLYEYSIDYDGALIMGERKKDENVLTRLEKNVPMAVSAVVWLDGDIVDNTMVSAVEDVSFSGILNLQFASSADLIPADMGHLKGLTGDKSNLGTKVESAQAIYENGQGIYTTKSWRDFAVAYTRAQSVMNNGQANEAIIYNANKELAEAQHNLTPVSKEALQDEINIIRQKMGSSNDIARIVLEHNGRLVAIDTFTDDQLTNNKGIIYRVDYNNNLQDEGNGIKTAIYTDETWLALASTLYEAEKLSMDPSAIEKEIDDAITALDTANNALVRNVYYTPYIMKDTLYYKAIGASNEDKYGVWYDSNFKRIMNEFTMVELDADAVPLDAATISMLSYFKVGSTDEITDISVQLNDVLKGQEIIAVRWSIPSIFKNGMTEAQIDEVEDLKKWANEYINPADALPDSTPADNTPILYKTEISALLDSAPVDNDTTTYEMAESWLLTMNSYKARALSETAKPTPKDTDPITFNQRLVLSKCISSAQTVKDYNTNTELNNATSAAMDLLNNAYATFKDARESIENLNNLIEAAGGTKVSEASLPEYVLPVGSERFDIAYGTLADNITHTAITVAENAHGVGEVTAVILTDKGVVLTASKTASVYYEAHEAVISGSAEVQADESITLNTSLIRNDDIKMEEKIADVTWASTNSDVLTVESNGSTTCIINGVSAGTAQVKVSVTTVQGNTYTAEFTVTVH